MYLQMNWPWYVFATVLAVLAFSDFMAANTCPDDIGGQKVEFDQRCVDGEISLGCNAGGKGQGCRFCGFDDFEACSGSKPSPCVVPQFCGEDQVEIGKNVCQDRCKRSAGEHWSTKTKTCVSCGAPDFGSMRIVFDARCEDGHESLGCNAAGRGQACRFCDAAPFPTCRSIRQSKCRADERWDPFLIGRDGLGRCISHCARVRVQLAQLLRRVPHVCWNGERCVFTCGPPKFMLCSGERDYCLGSECKTCDQDSFWDGSRCMKCAFDEFRDGVECRKRCDPAGTDRWNGEKCIKTCGPPHYRPCNFDRGHCFDGVCYVCLPSQDWDGKNCVTSCVRDYMSCARRFAPLVRMHPDETWFPSSVDDYLKVSFVGTLAVVRECPKWCFSFLTVCSRWACKLKNVPNVLERYPTRSNLKGFKHRSAFIMPKTPAKNRKFRNPVILVGHLPRENWVPVYLKRKVHGDSIELQYNMFYPFNYGKSIFGLGHHLGDWEEMSVLVEKNKPVRINMRAHGSRFTYTIEWYAVKKQGDHPIIYSAKGSHGHHPRAGKFSYSGVSDRTKDGGEQWQTWRNVQEVDWEFDGRWGTPQGSHGGIGKTTRWHNGFLCVFNDEVCKIVDGPTCISMQNNFRLL